MKMLKVSKFLGLFVPLSITVASFSPFYSSCSTRNMVKSIDGTNWIGYVDGSFTDNDYFVDVYNQSVTYKNGSKYKAMNLVIPNYVSYNNVNYRVILGQDCFLNNYNILESVELNDFADSISDGCFCNCTRLTKLIMHYKPVKIGDFAFFDCINFEGIIVKYDSYYSNDWTTNITWIGDSAFANTLVSGDLFFYEDLERIRYRAFYNCDNLTSVNLSFTNKLTKIDSEAFMDCNHIVDVYFSSSIYEIGIAAFSLCDRLKTVHIPEEKQKLYFDNFAFSTCPRFEGFSKQIDPVKCGNSCFLYDTKFKTAYWDVPYELSYIYTASFNGTGFTDITILPPESGGPIDIYSYAFAECPYLISIDLSKFKSLPTWTGLFIFDYLPTHGTIYVSKEVWAEGEGDAPSEWYDYFGTDHLGLDLVQRGTTDKNKWQFKCA